ncbi:hypothetical protein D3C81_1510230 [compost metagenome]
MAPRGAGDAIALEVDYRVQDQRQDAQHHQPEEDLPAPCRALFAQRGHQHLLQHVALPATGGAAATHRGRSTLPAQARTALVGLAPRRVLPGTQFLLERKIGLRRRFQAVTVAGLVFVLRLTRFDRRFLLFCHAMDSIKSDGGPADHSGGVGRVKRRFGEPVDSTLAFLGPELGQRGAPARAAHAKAGVWRINRAMCRAHQV